MIAYDMIEEFLSVEDDALIEKRNQQFIEPFWQKNVINGYFSGTENVQIAYAYVLNPDPIGSIAISSGRIETLLKYKELIFNLYHAGFSVFIHDHRGQGLSGRLLEDSEKGYVGSFSDYVSDFKIFYDNVIAPNSIQKPILLSHSMGAAIASLYLLSHPEDFEKCVMSAPMFGIRPALPKWLTCLLIDGLTLLNSMFGSSPWYFLGQSKYNPKTFAQNELTHSPTRYKIFREVYKDNPQCKLGGVTTAWLKQADKAMSIIHKNASAITTPILLLQAGDDNVVDNAKQTKVAMNLANCTLLQLENAKHEVLFESEDIRDRSLRAILRFVS
ncbi:alpha/beta fold hydrolase [Aliiglaciecola lipolytica]|uniref:Lysophospholipase n=1 Tax=Aliiglaciecola lipolytica E3 TaxID=1127673 RepID=K6YHI2_9ALTE|nr:alpha/beta fold hydrolase [Aliiglaciecola lipolytica]GAC16083.1 lysophospholipase [Aliiglaciecola lipolytica E3]